MFQDPKSHKKLILSGTLIFKSLSNQFIVIQTQQSHQCFYSVSGSMLNMTENKWKIV